MRENAENEYHECIGQARPHELVSQMQPKVKFIWRTDDCIDQLQACRLHRTQLKIKIICEKTN